MTKNASQLRGKESLTKETSLFFLLAQVFFFLKRKSVPGKKETGGKFCIFCAVHFNHKITQISTRLFILFPSFFCVHLVKSRGFFTLLSPEKKKPRENFVFFHCLFPIAHCLLPIAYCPLPIASSCPLSSPQAPRSTRQLTQPIPPH